jgi:MFS family permease
MSTADSEVADKAMGKIESELCGAQDVYPRPLRHFRLNLRGITAHSRTHRQRRLSIRNQQFHPDQLSRSPSSISPYVYESTDSKRYVSSDRYGEEKFDGPTPASSSKTPRNESSIETTSMDNLNGNGSMSAKRATTSQDRESPNYPRLDNARLSHPTFVSARKNNQGWTHRWQWLPSRRIILLVMLFVALVSEKAADATTTVATDSKFSTPNHRRHQFATSKEPVAPITSPAFLQIRGGGTSKGPRRLSNSFHKADKRPSSESRRADNTNLLALFRVLFFIYYASLGSLLPYLPVYYHSLGHGGQIIGMLGAIKPFTTFLVAPLWGIISDSSGSPFTVLYFTFLVSLVAQLLVAFRHDPHWIMAMVFITAFFNAPVKSLLDAMVISHLEDRSKYGRLRLWGQLGFGVGSSGVGFLLSHSKHRPYTSPIEGTSMRDHLDEFWQSITGYKLLFFTYALLSIPTFMLIRTFDNWTRDTSKTTQSDNAKNQKKKSKTVQKKNQENTSVWQGIQLLLHNSDALLFFSLVLVVGISSGVIENFAYVRIREVGGTGKEMGLSRLVSSMAGAPMFWFSGPLTEMLGADRVLVLSLISYVLRYFNYAFMQSPLQGLPAEALRGVTFAAFWSTCTIYASRIAPKGMQATMVSFA